jgi:hypothetical protein
MLRTTRICTGVTRVYAGIVIHAQNSTHLKITSSNHYDGGEKILTVCHRLESAVVV